MFENIRREQNEYRVGADVDIGGFKLTLLRTVGFLQRRQRLPEITPETIPSWRNLPVRVASRTTAPALTGLAI